MKFPSKHGKADFLSKMILHKTHDFVDNALLSALGFFRRFLLKQRNFQIIYARAEFLIINGFEYVIGNLQAQSLTTVSKIVITRHNNKRRFGVLHSAELNNFKTVHYRNVDIHNHDIGIERIYL